MSYYKEELERGKKLFTTQQGQYILDDLATAWIAKHDYNNPSDALFRLRMVKRKLRALGYTASDINNYFLSVQDLKGAHINRKLYPESIYNDNNELREDVSAIAYTAPARNVTDMIIDTIKDNPRLLRSLSMGSSKQYISKTYHVTAPTLLIEFYRKHETIINQ